LKLLNDHVCGGKIPSIETIAGRTGINVAGHNNASDEELMREEEDDDLRRGAMLMPLQ